MPSEGRSRNPCAYLPRRLQIASSLAFVSLVIVTVLIGFPHHDQTPIETAKDRVHQAAENIWHPFKAPVHTPPQQSNSTDGETSWLSDWKWLRPFSSSTTFEENRLVLPPEPSRIIVYTYYDAGLETNSKIKEAEHQLLLIWRRAWWSKGFRPVVLGKAEAEQNPLYANLHNADRGEIEISELMRWLAWGTMGTGILSNWLAVPMTNYDNPTLASLRRGEFPKLLRYEGLQDAVLAGDKTSINAAIDFALNGGVNKKKKMDMISALPEGSYSVDADPNAFAFYTLKTLTAKYKDIAELLMSSDNSIRGRGMLALPNLINAHLHTTWQNVFKEGISVLKPSPEHMTLAVRTATDLARNLSRCSPSDYPASCPPNQPKCTPCIGYYRTPITLRPLYKHLGNQFVIATVPHPYTFNALTNELDSLSIAFIVRHTKRDQYLNQVARGIDGGGINPFEYLVRLKEVIASSRGQSSLWMTAERSDDAQWQEDLSWLFGFPIPLTPTESGESEAPIPTLAPTEPKPEFPGPVGVRTPTAASLEHQKQILENCRRIVRVQAFKASNRRIREAVEAWNLADTELWKFVRAFNARRRMERKKWEVEERSFAGSDSRRAWGRWLDPAKTDDDSRM